MHYLSLTLPVFLQRNHGILFHLLIIKSSINIQLTSYHFRFYFALKNKATAKITFTVINSLSSLFCFPEGKSEHRINIEYT